MEEIKNTTAPEPSSTRLIATLGIAGLLSGLLLVGAYLYTLPMIEANKAAALERAIYKVLPGCTSFETLVLRDAKLTVVKELKAVSGGKPEKTIYAGHDDAGKLVGFAIPSDEPGFQDLIVGILGYHPETKTIVGFEVLDSKETPGLGDKIIKDQAFIVQFESLSVEPEIVSVKKGEKKNPNEVEAITGATISSKTVVKLLNKGIGEWQGAIEGYLKTQVN
ncbi:MAG: FMN-binding protein [Saprospiraceae bacterium]|nr:FMN-binding protein [Saprospiraceae bacterium]MCF8250921.1 FMN-binding protein [Saprospiraceae bacterium]MCF8283042.1 FMN-binding protein [Bacteroidales bacterium]MCF8311886.1 FMN-binding protein [Saprospiraceae bacterium]MCF8441894.1 FMN-binding protein [Saprospiraceae bacterium]